MGKTLVAYFSPTGTTRRAASKLAGMLGADLYEIRPLVSHTAADLDRRAESSGSSAEMKDPSSRPALSDHDANAGAYDTILIGFPIRRYTAPAIISTFLEAYEFAGKRIAFFSASGGSSIMKAVMELSETLAGKGTVLGGINMGDPSLTDEVISDWIKSLQ